MENMLVLANENQPVVTSFNAVTVEDKKRIYNALNNPTGNIKDIINQEIELTDYHMQFEERTDQNTGVVYGKITTTVILSDGRAMTSTYKSFAKSLINLMSVFGTPSEWPDHKLKVVVRSVSYQGGLHDGLRIDIA